MSLDSLIKEKVKRLDSVPDAFVSKVDQNQKLVYTEIIKLLDTLERKGGEILLTQKNIAKIEGIINKVREVFFNDQYIKALTEFASEFDQQAKITDKLFKAGFDEVPNSKLFDAVLTATKKSAVDLFGEAVTEQAFFQPLREQILTAITNQASFNDTVDAIRLITVGTPKADGLIQSHAKTYARTSFAVADRNYTTTIADNYNVEWYNYSGGEIATTREFCLEREGNYYPKKEIESWGNIDYWPGKMKGTNSKTIMTNLGGWNCRHSLIPVSVFSIPKSRVLKAISEGYFTPTPAVKKWLGIAA